MGVYARSTSCSTSARTDEYEEQLYCSARQDAEDVICEGSDAEQTAEEIWRKRHRYEQIARRYINGHRPPIQSASLRGPLNPKSGWVNPWRYRPPGEADWWQPGSENMLFTKKNVMKRAADHGMGYMEPPEALAWCKAVAQAEAKKEFNQFDSMETVCSKESDTGDRSQESQTNGLPLTRPALTTKYGHQINRDHCTNAPHLFAAGAPYTDGMEKNDSTNSNMSGTKRLADLQWLKGSYVSKRARWDDPPISSPTPMPDLQIKRNQRRRKSAPSQNGRSNLISQPVTPWLHDVQQVDQASQYNGSTAQESKSNYTNIGRQPEDLDGGQEESPDAAYVSVSEFLSGSQSKRKGLQPMDRYFSDLEHEDLTIALAKDDLFNTSVGINGIPVSRRTSYGSNTLPKLSRDQENRVEIELSERESFVTVVAPSSGNLEKFQFRKKRRKSNKHQSPKNHKDCLQNVPKSSSVPSPANMHKLSSSREGFATLDLTRKLPMECMDHGISADPGVTPDGTEALETTALPEKETTTVRDEMSTGSKHTHVMFPKKATVMPVNVLPSLRITSPFAPFGVSEFMPSPAVGTRLPWEVVGDDVGEPSSDESDESDIIQLDDTSAPSLVPSEHDLARKSSKPLESPLERSSRLSHPAGEYNGSVSPEPQELIGALAPDCNALLIRSSGSHGAEGSEDSSRASPSSTSLTRSQAMPILPDMAANLTQEPSIDVASTQSFNSTAPKSLLDQHISLAVLPTVPTVNKDALQGYELNVFDQPIDDEIPSGLPHEETFFLHDDDANVLGPHVTENIGSVDEEIVDQSTDVMEVIQNALSQDCGGYSSRASSQHGKNHSSEPLTLGGLTELTGITILKPNEEDEIPTTDGDQDNSKGCEPQSPWAAESFLLGNTSAINQPSEAVAIIEGESSRDTSSFHAEVEANSGWQLLPQVAQDNDGIVPLKDFIISTPSSDLPTDHTNPNDVSNTQLLIEAATNNPWASGSKNRGSMKPKKHVSFGILPSEENPDSQPEISRSSFLKPVLGSPPPPHTFDREEDPFSDGTIATRKFEKHFSAAAGLTRLLARGNGALVLCSPAVGAMAEAFLAADRATSMEQERLARMSESPTRHLKSKSDVEVNLPPFETADCDLETNLQDFIGDAGDFLADWSVESEVRNNDLKAKRDSINGPSRRRNLFGKISGW